MNIEAKIRKVAVLGAGVMGAQIAAHFINAQIPTVLFDMPIDAADKSALVKRAIAQLKQLKPSPLATLDVVQHIQAANYDDDLTLLSECDLIIEAIAERMDFKQQLFTKIAPYISEHAILASNTSGLSINALADILPADLQPRFLGIHFFNPPRYMHLTEIIPSAKTADTLLDTVETFLVGCLGKGVLRALDTPNFIANRIGVFSMLSTMHYAGQFQLPLEIVDALTGPIIGRPKSATFRTMDVVGLDTMTHVIHTMQKQLPEDPWCSIFHAPVWLEKLIDAGALGQKSQKGIYQKQGKAIHVFDLDTGEYRPADGKIDSEVAAILKQPKLADRLFALRQHAHPQAQFLWACLRDLFHYTAYHLNDIAHNVRDVDLALRWGFGWQQGVFECWQEAGWENIREAINEDIADGKALATVHLPSWVAENNRVYSEDGAYSPQVNKQLARRDLAIYRQQITFDTVLGETVTHGHTLYENSGVRLWHTGDAIGILSFKSKVNAVNTDVIIGIKDALQYAQTHCEALVIWQNDATNFSLGADIAAFLPLFKDKDRVQIDAIIASFQEAMMALKQAPIPVVAGLRGRAFGGGCELLLHCDHVVAALESYPGLVEIGVGLLPAGGGCKAFAEQAAQQPTLLPAIQQAFQTIAMAEVGSSARHAQQLGYLSHNATVIMHPNEVLFVAKQVASMLAQSHYRPALATQFPVAGNTGIATLQMQLVNMREGGFITDYEYVIGKHIAYVLCGGDVEEGSLVDAQWLLRLEREAFVELACQTHTHERIEHMLNTGKPLRN